MVAKEGIIGGEVEPVEINAPVGQLRVRQAGTVQRDDGQVRRQRGHAPRHAPGIEGGDEQRGGLAGGQFGDRTRRLAEQEGAEPADILHVEFHRRGHFRMQGKQRRREALRVENGERAGLGEFGGQRGDGVRGERVHERLVEHVAALAGVEGLDVQHGSGGR